MKIPYSSLVPARRVESRQCALSSVPSKTPTTVFVLPTSRASSMAAPAGNQRAENSDQKSAVSGQKSGTRGALSTERSTMECSRSYGDTASGPGRSKRSRCKAAMREAE